MEKKMWNAYAKQAGGVTFDGKPLPDWDGLGADRQACWMAAANAVDDEIERLRHEFRELHRDISMFMDNGPLKQDLLETIADVLGEEK
jgi:hypothetical protein